MSWGPFETRLDELRAEISRQPAAVLEIITLELERPRSPQLRPRERSRLYGLRAQARKELGLFDEAEKDLWAARGIRKAGAVADTELEIRFAERHAVLRLTLL